jgi:hypothetical protein
MPVQTSVKILVCCLHLQSYRSPYYTILRAQYGLDGFPLEKRLFEPPAKLNNDGMQNINKLPNNTTTGTSILATFFKRFSNQENNTLHIQTTVFKTPQISSNSFNATTGVQTARLINLKATGNNILYNTGNLSLLTNFDIK